MRRDEKTANDHWSFVAIATDAVADARYWVLRQYIWCLFTLAGPIRLVRIDPIFCKTQVERGQVYVEIGFAMQRGQLYRTFRPWPFGTDAEAVSAQSKHVIDANWWEIPLLQRA